MTITILRPTDISGWEVWAHLGHGNPLNEHESFIIGTGDIYDDAVAMAVTELENALNELQQPPPAVTS